jgi:hypothetical protein
MEGCKMAASEKTGSAGKATSKRPGTYAENDRGVQQVEMAVKELFQLLEAYAPTWYSEGHHQRAEAALRERGESLRSVFRELSDLLEQYGPGWFTEQHYAGAESVRKLLECGTSSVPKPKRRGRSAGA